MISATLPAGQALLSLSSNGTPNKTVTLAICIVFFLLMVAAVAAGVTIAVSVQIVMSAIEIFLFAFLAFFDAHHSTTFSWSGPHPRSSSTAKVSSRVPWSRASTTGNGT